MLHTARRAALTLSVIGVLVAPVELRAEKPRIVIRMYDADAAGTPVREAAMRTTAAIVRDAGVEVQWMDCSQGGADHPCRAVRGARDLVVRIMPAAQSKATGSRDALSIRGTVGDQDLQLGFAAVDSGVHAGVLATIYYDRVQTVADRGGLDSSELLGRAMAHEVGHGRLGAPLAHQSGQYSP